jgi:septum formation protein
MPPNTMEPKGLVLASSSPRRRSLLLKHGYTFAVYTADVEEVQEASMTPTEIVEWNARLKTLPVADAYPDCVVVGADTIVALGPKIFGKPASLEEAVLMLEQLNGRQHTVYSGVCLVHKSATRERVFVERTVVRFFDLTPEQRLAYLKRIHPLDKAGAYAAQDDRGELIAGYEGSFSNVIGLPMESLASLLAAFGVHPGQPTLRASPQSRT